MQVTIIENRQQNRQQLMVLPGGGCTRAFLSSSEGPLVEGSARES